MQWRGAKRTKRNSVFGRSALAWLAGILVSGAIASPVFAVDNEVGAVVCGTGSPGASISIDQPTDDSVVNQAVTTFRGTINNTSQIVVEIDGDYVSTVAIGSNQTTFATDLSLSQGTHTIVMTANDICGVHDAKGSIVITYQPSVEPSSGGTTPTQVDQQPDTPVKADNPITDKDIFHQILQLPVIGSAVSVVGDFVAATGLESTVSTSNTVVGISRVGITVVALTSVVMASSLAPFAAQAVPGISEVFNIASNRSMLYLGWVIRGAGILAMAFAYFL
jgi:hypothetical protein